MLEAAITLNPYGQGENLLELVGIKVANIGRNIKGNHDKSKYCYAYWIKQTKSGFNDGSDIHGVIYGHDRSESVLSLFEKILVDKGTSACDISEEMMNFWKEKE